LKRSLLSGPGQGPGLRGGTFDANFGDVLLTTTLTQARWTDDATVSGTLYWNSSNGTLNGELSVNGRGHHNGTLHLHGGWLIPNTPRSITLTGTLGGYNVHATVPSS
jgi:hypothetical protein